MQKKHQENKHDYRTVVRIAAATGVNPKTVSKHLNGGGNRHYATSARDVVLRAAAELGLTPAR